MTRIVSAASSGRGSRRSKRSRPANAQPRSRIDLPTSRPRRCSKRTASCTSSGGATPRTSGLTGDVTGGGQELGLYRIEGTDLFFRSLQLDPKAQYTYDLIVDFGNPQADPGNPYTVDNGFVGLLRAAHARVAGVAAPRPAGGQTSPRGTLDGFPFRSEILDNTREIRVWRPADLRSRSRSNAIPCWSSTTETTCCAAA